MKLILATTSPSQHLLRAIFYRVKNNLETSAKLMRFEQPTQQLSPV